MMVEHGGVGHLGREQGKAFGVKQGSRVLQFASPSFDAWWAELVVSLVRGQVCIWWKPGSCCRGEDWRDYYASVELPL